MPKDLELLIEPEFKKTPREKRKDKKKGYGYEKGDFEIPMIGALGGGMTVAAGAAYDKAQKLNTEYKKQASEKKGKPKGKKYGETDLLSGDNYYPPKP